MKLAAIASLLLSASALLPSHADAHDIVHDISREQAVVVTFSYGGAEPFSFESYELFRAGEDIPFQVGRTDALGRVAFPAPQPGSWRLKVFSESGHGADLDFDTTQATAPGSCEAPKLGNRLKALVGASLLFGIFGLLNLFVKKREVSP